MAKLKINSENAEFQIIQSLKMNREKRSKLNEIFIEGIECIKQAIKSNIEITRIIIKDINELSNWGKDVIRQFNNVKIIEMSEKLFITLADKINPSEMLITAKIIPKTLDDITAKNPFIIVFDRPSDHGNLGAIIRSANAFNVDGIFIIGHSIDIYESKVIRASLGSIFFTNIIKIPMNGNVNSLNISCAASIIMWEIYKNIRD